MLVCTGALRVTDSYLRTVPSLVESTLLTHPLLPYEPMWLGPSSYQSCCVFRRPAESV